MQPRSWNVGHLSEVYALPDYATLSIDDRKTTITSSLIYTIILIRSAQELFPELDKKKLHKISALTLHQIGKYTEAKNRSESDEFPELPALMNTDRKLLRQIVEINRTGLISTQRRHFLVFDNLSKTVMIVHDLFAQDDAAMEDALYVKSTIGLCAMLQHACNKETEYDLCME